MAGCMTNREEAWQLPPEIAPQAWLDGGGVSDSEVARALRCEEPDEGTFMTLLRAKPEHWLEALAQRARTLTRHHFGRTVQLYTPLYLSNYCSGGCAYCGFAADRQQLRRRLELPEIERELRALKRSGFEQVLLLTGERTTWADFDYLLTATRLAASLLHEVTVEAFPMSTTEYRTLAEAGCAGVTLYQECYDPARYREFHRWGPKRNFPQRLEAPMRALAGGIPSIGMGALLGLADPYHEALALYRHVRHLQKEYWRSAFSLSFPRLRPEVGGFEAPYQVSDLLLAQLIFAFRICLPETTLVLSTREEARLRDGLAGVGINRMSTGSLTTVGGYEVAATSEGQFEVADMRSVETFCAMLRSRGLEPVFKNWDAAYRSVVVQSQGG